MRLECFIETWQRVLSKKVIILQTNEYRRMGCVHDCVPRLWYCCRTMFRGPCSHCQMRHVLTLLCYCSELRVCFKSQFTYDDNWRRRHEKGTISSNSTFEKTTIKNKYNNLSSFIKSIYGFKQVEKQYLSHTCKWSIDQTSFLFSD